MSVAIYNFNGVLDSLYYKIRDKDDMANDWQSANTVVVWQDAVGVLSTMCSQAKQMGKRVIVAEHGLLSINDYIPPLAKPLMGDVFMAWGNVTRRWLIEAGIPREKIVVTGSTVFNKLGARNKHDGKNVLFAPRHWSSEIEENLEIVELLKTYDKATIYSKIIVGEHDPFKYPNPIMSERTEGNHLALCYDALKDADVVVGIGEGTFAALAYWMNIPYISVENWRTKNMLGKDYTREEFNSQISYACVQAKPCELLEAIDTELEYPDNMEAERKRFIDEYLDGGIPSRALEKQLQVVYG